MLDLTEKVSYVRGLAEGMGIKEETNEGKLLNQIINVLGDMAQAIAELETAQSETEEYVETLDEDLADVEYAVFDYDEDYDEDDDMYDGAHYIELECPHCHETIYFDEDIFEDDDDILCPSCNKTIYSEDEYEKEDDDN